MCRHTILEQWLKEKLGVVLEDEFRVGNAIKNGKIIAMLLDKYEIVPKAQLKIRQSDSNLIKQNFENWTMLKQWLLSVDFDVREMELMEICAGNNSTAHKFLYRLYLHLNSFKDKIFINTKLTSKFTVTSSDYLLSNRQNQQSNIRTLIGYKVKRISRKYLNEQCLCNARKKTRKYKCDSMKNVLLDIQQFETMHENRPSPYHVPPVPQGVKTISVKSIPQSSSTLYSIECDENVQCKEGNTNECEDENFLKICTQDLVNQSKYEKKTCEALQLLKCQQYTLLENSRLMNNLAAEETRNCEMDILEYEGEGWDVDKEEWKKIEDRRRQNLCQDITNDIISISHKLSILNMDKVPNTLWKDCKQAFIKDKINEMIDSINQTCYEFNEDNEEYNRFGNSETSIMRLDYLECLAKADVYDYLKFERDWIIDHSFSLLEQEEVAFIVTKLLRHLATVPVPPLKPHLPSFNGTFSLHGVPDKYHSLFKSILQEHKILFFTPEDLVNFCVAEYKKETPLCEMVGYLSPEEEQSCVSQLSDSIQNIEEEGEEVNLFASKQTQTPAVLPEKIFAEISSAAIVGRKIAEHLITGKQISSELIVEALLCFVIRAVEWKGFVLVNFPNHLNDVSEMESNLQGRFVPLQNDENEETKLFYRSKLLPFRVNSDAPFIPYISHCISVVTNNEKINPEVNMVHKFYKRYNRYKQFRCRAKSGLHKNVVISVIKFILNNTESNTMEEGSESNSIELMDLSSFGLLEESKSKSSLFSHGESIVSFEIEPEYEGEDGEIVEEEKGSISENELFIKRFHSVDFDAPSEFLSTMGQLWKNMERHYLDVLGSVFSLKRKENSTVLPFRQLVVNLFKDALNLPNNKQEMVDLFQKEFNNISAEMRCSEYVKNLLHDKVFYFQLKLWEISDANQEIERETVAKQAASLDWYMDHLNVTCKLYLIIVNAEIARFSETMQILADYYLLYLNKVPLPEKIVNIEEKHIDLGSGSFNNDEVNDLQSFIKFNSADGFYTDSEFLYERIESTFEYYENEISKYAAIRYDYSKMNDDVRKEMESAIASENQRILLRLHLIQRNFKSEVAHFELWCTDFLNNLFDTMVARYENEIAAINNLCSVINVAIEEETLLYRRLLLKEDTFCIAADEFLLPPQSSNGDVLSRSYVYMSTSLTPTHIENLREVFQSVASDDFILNSAFLFILEDILIEDTHKDCLPKSWKMLKREDLKNILHDIFGNTLQYCWKDFLINAFEIPYPSAPELISMAEVFQASDPERSQLIFSNDFISSKFWFDVHPNPSPELVKELLKFKQLLFKLFQVDRERTNYTLVLLHLCKDLDPVKGFCKALSLVSSQKADLVSSEVLNFSEDPGEENSFPRSRPESRIFDSQFLITYESFEEVLSSCFQSERLSNKKFPEDIQKCLLDIQSQWTLPFSMCKVLHVIHSEPCLLSFLQSSHTFKAYTMSEIIGRYIYVPVTPQLDCSDVLHRIEDCPINFLNYEK